MPPSQQFISSYLVPKRPHPARSGLLRRWIIRARLVLGAHSKLTSNLTLAVAGWFGLILSIQFLSAPVSPIGRSPFALKQELPLSDLVNPPALAAPPKTAAALPSGPSGYQLQPINVAPYRTYSNNYAGGNCTWYVASRRQIPGGWGDARRWYYNAVSSGWRVGNIPAIGSIAWTSAGRFGHVALVEDISADGRRVYISEMNYNGLWVRSSRWTARTDFKYIY